MVVFDNGAHSGYYSLLAARRVGTTGRVFAFEPLPANQEYLKRHLQLNRLNQVTLILATVASRSRIARFDTGPNSYQGRLSEDGSIMVQVISLDEEIDTGNFPEPDLIKIDVEGAEGDVLKGAQRILSKKHPILFISVHGNENRLICEEILVKIGYRTKPIWKG